MATAGGAVARMPGSWRPLWAAGLAFVSAVGLVAPRIRPHVRWGPGSRDSPAAGGMSSVSLTTRRADRGSLQRDVGDEGLGADGHGALNDGQFRLLHIIEGFPAGHLLKIDGSW